jgi:hypothetical protein
MARIAFSDTTNKNGLVETLARLTGTPTASTSSYPIAQKTLDINSALANFTNIAMRSSGKWQFDDTNQSGLPTFSINIVSGTASYAFTTDSSSPANQILEIQKLRIKDVNGRWTDEIKQIDKNNTDISQFQDVTGTPEYYDLVGNNIVFYPTPNYNSTSGIELTISRTPSYFLASDTTKKAGIPDMFDDYLYLRPAYLYCVSIGHKKARDYGIEVRNMEDAIKKYYSARNKTSNMVITTEPINSI